MKKILLLLLVVLVLVTGCTNGDEKKPGTNNAVDQSLTAQWPVDTFFYQVPKLTDDVEVNKTENDKGIKYIIHVKDIKYKDVRNWVLNLEENGFKDPYLSNLFPVKESDLIKNTVSWKAMNPESNIYIAVTYNNKKLYDSKEDCIITFLNYDPLK